MPSAILMTWPPFQNETYGDGEHVEKIWRFCQPRLVFAELIKAISLTNVMTHHIWLWPFLAQGVFFLQNKCLQWIQNHEKPLV